MSAYLVGDGICDCCDGSDEAAGVCPNECKRMFEEAAAKAAARAEKRKAGEGKYNEYVAMAAEKLGTQKVGDEGDDRSSERARERWGAGGWGQTTGNEGGTSAAQPLNHLTSLTSPPGGARGEEEGAGGHGGEGERAGDGQG